MAITTIKVGQERKRYKDLDCALTDCCIQSPNNKVLVSKIWNKQADDSTDYIVDIL